LWRFKDEGPPASRPRPSTRNISSIAPRVISPAWTWPGSTYRWGTRSLRYAKYKGGDKSRPREDLDPEKSRAAEVDPKKFRAAVEDEEYLRLQEEYKRRNE
jgi:hypothetical protein